jgi:NAD(P)-dependent dehydrogenase (short-subunit alcohol dehydrogenase family)
VTSRFTGRTAIITGAGGAIGAAAAVRLAAEGAQILAVDRDGAAAARTVAAVTEAGGRAVAHVADVSRAADVAAYVAAGVELGGGEIGLFFNNAGIEGPLAEIQDIDDDAFDAVVAVNLRGVFLGLKHVLPHMRAGGAIVNTASTGGLRGNPRLGAYVATKHAVLGLTKTAAKENAARGIRVNAVCPGAVEGPMIDAIEQATGGAAAHERFLSMIPAGRFATPGEIAGAVAYLMSEDASYVTGTAHVVDGARTC